LIPKDNQAHPLRSQRVAVITGASQGIGAGLVSAFRGAGYAVVGTLRAIDSSQDLDYLTVPGDIAKVDTARRVVDQALDRFGRIDTLINNAGIFISKPFTDYTPDDDGAITAVNLAGRTLRREGRSVRLPNDARATFWRIGPPAGARAYRLH
jgi:NAD(P)-dependent dehydrogenase (short-subunit alcohol dehydrogenase family)